MAPEPLRRVRSVGAWLDSHIWVLSILSIVAVCTFMSLGFKVAFEQHDHLTAQVAEVCQARDLGRPGYIRPAEIWGPLRQDGTRPRWYP